MGDHADGNYDEVHYSVRKRFGETLTYFFVALGPTYENSKVIAAFDALFDIQLVHARHYFEVYGEVDFIVRAWVPATKLVDFSQVMEEFLISQGCGIKYVNQFTVASNPYHWIFTTLKPKARLEGADGELLDQTTVEEINAVLIGDHESNEASDLRSKLLALNLIASSSPGTGIRFFVGIPAPRGGVDTVILNALVSDVSNVLRNAASIQHSVVYRGAAGQGLMLLVEGIATRENYDAIDSAVTTMNEAGLRRFAIKTVTYLSTRSRLHQSNGVGALTKSEVLIDPKDIHDASYYLSADEGDRFERKATFELDLNRYLATDEELANPKLEDEVLGTIVAFLNSDGGEILVGVAEEAPFKGGLGEKLRAVFPRYNVGHATDAGSDSSDHSGLRICGVAWEYKFTKNKSWESYETKIRERCTHRIGASRLPYIRIHRLTAEGKDLAIIQVQPLEATESAYLDKDKFYVRQGPSTNMLAGDIRDKYQRWREHNRSDHATGHR